MTSNRTIVPNFTTIRHDFPRAARNLWLAAPELHPYSVHALRAIEQYAQYRALAANSAQFAFTPDKQQETKELYAALIGATADEIAFVQSTTDGENIVLAGLGLSQPGRSEQGNTSASRFGAPKRGTHLGNVVIDDLHFEASKHIYTMLQKQGNIELRVVNHRNWQTDVDDFAKLIDHETRLVSVALVSQVNGYLADIKAISDVAHAHGAYVYADVIQAAGCIPIDVRAMGIDFCAANTYKWLMGDFGVGYLYIRSELQEEVLQPTRFSMKQVKQYADFDFELHSGAARYEGGGNVPFLVGVCAHEGVKYINNVGIANIRAHVKPLTDRLQEALPALGYTPITSPDTPTPIVSYLPPDIDETKAKLDHAFGEQVVSFRAWYWTDENRQRERVEGMRIGVSVYNNEEDIERFVVALAG